MNRLPPAATKQNSARILADFCLIPQEVIFEGFMSTPPRFPKIRLAEMKMFARMVDCFGFKIDMTLNKALLEQVLLNCISVMPAYHNDAMADVPSVSPLHQQPNTTIANSSALVTGASKLPASSSNIPTTVSQPTVLKPHPSSNSAYSKASITKPAAPTPTPAPIQPNFPKMSTTPSSGMSQSSSNTMNNANGRVFQQSSSTVPPSSYKTQLSSSSSYSNYSPSIQSKIRELNAKKKRIFEQAMEMEGMTAMEVLNALQFLNTADCNLDAVIDKVVMKRSALCDPKDDENIAALERTLYDRAVMESELERDNIQKKKRQKLNDLKDDIQSEIFSSDEFKASIFLHGSSSVPDSSSSATTTSADKDGSVDTGKLSRGSTVLRALCFTYDYVAKDSRELELCEIISSSMADIRVLLVEFLLLERDALKYYKDASYAYLLYVMHTIDAVMEGKLENDIKNIPNVQRMSNSQWRYLFATFSEKSNELRVLLETLKLSFQRGMAKIPRDGALIPELFRLKSLLPYVRAVSNNVEQDGIELESEDLNLGLLSDRESTISDDDSDEGDYDDDY